jgi:hypothetical protein
VITGDQVYEELRGGAQAKREVQGGLRLDVVVRERAAVLQLHTTLEDQALLLRGEALLVLNRCLDVEDGVARRNPERDGVLCQLLDEDLHAGALPLEVELVLKKARSVGVSTVLVLLWRKKWQKRTSGAGWGGRRSSASLSTHVHVDNALLWQSSGRERC